VRPPRFRLRTLLVAVAAVGFSLWLMARRERFRGLAAHHRSRASRGATPHVFIAGRPVCSLPTPRGLWHAEVADKFERAAAHPWLPVAPDPPPPE
jgi:hypothetical protein